MPAKTKTEKAAGRLSKVERAKLEGQAMAYEDAAEQIGKLRPSIIMTAAEAERNTIVNQIVPHFKKLAQTLRKASRE